MRNLALALFCLCCVAHGRRVQMAKEQTPDGAKSLASLLQAFNSAVKPSLVPLNRQASRTQLASSRNQVYMKPQSNFVADMQRRTIMNLLTLGAVSVPVGWILFIFISYFIPPNEGGAGGAVTALDALGGAITFEGWLKDNLPETRKLVQGIRGDATYLIVNKDRKIEDFGVNAVCTHLGCVVPWNRAQNKFMCPCHGSQYDYSGKVVRGPAPLSLALAHVVDTGNGKVSFTPWTEQDFRTGQDPWWKP